jgi:hypothetical protein
VDEGTPLTLTAAASAEPGRHFTVFKWDADGDGDYDFEGLETDVEWTYDLAGSYTARLWVEDVDGTTDETTVVVTVLDLDATFDIILPSDVKENVPAMFGLENLYDPGTEEFVVTWYFGDGESTEGLTVNHTYLEQGSYSGRVTVVDNEGTVVDAEWTSPLPVANSAPEVELSELVLKATEDSVFKVSVFGQDTPQDTITYSFDGPGGKIDPVTGEFKWTPRDEHAGKKNTFVFRATDEDGGVGEKEVTIPVKDVDNDFMGMSVAAGLGLIIAMIVVLLIVGLWVARTRGLIGGGAVEDDVIEPEARVDLDEEVEVDAGPEPAPKPTPISGPASKPDPAQKKPVQKMKKRKRPKTH